MGGIGGWTRGAAGYWVSPGRGGGWILSEYWGWMSGPGGQHLYAF